LPDPQQHTLPSPKNGNVCWLESSAGTIASTSSHPAGGCWGRHSHRWQQATVDVLCRCCGYRPALRMPSLQDPLNSVPQILRTYLCPCAGNAVGQEATPPQVHAITAGLVASLPEGPPAAPSCPHSRLQAVQHRPYPSPLFCQSGRLQNMHPLSVRHHCRRGLAFWISKSGNTGCTMTSSARKASAKPSEGGTKDDRKQLSGLWCHKPWPGGANATGWSAALQGLEPNVICAATNSPPRRWHQAGEAGVVLRQIRHHATA
jgi:hypothetical protein